MLSIAFLAVAALAAAVRAQDPVGPTPAPDANAAVAERMQRALAASAAAVDTGFRARWGPDLPAATGAKAPTGYRGDATGSWHVDRMHLRLAGEKGDEFVIAGTRTIARDATLPWAVRRGRHADGSAAPFLPDPVILLRWLADQGLTVTHAEAGAVDDRPVMVATANLVPEQVAEAVWAGLIPDAFAGVASRVVIVGGGAGGRAPAPRPTASVDVAVHFDPSIGDVRRVHVRCWLKPEIQRGGRIAMRFDAEGRPERVDLADLEADEKANAEAAKQPLRHADGLPLRPRQGLLVSDLVLDLRDAGRTPAPALDERAAKLLSR